MRFVALTVALLALGSGASSKPRIAYRQGPQVFVNSRLVSPHLLGALRWSGDGKLLSVGNRIAGGPRLSNAYVLEWAPTGETAAAPTTGGGVLVWTPSRGSRRIVPDGWGATSVAWGANGTLAIGRYNCRPPCGVPRNEEVWIWRSEHLKRVVGPLRGVVLPMVVAVSAQGRPLWWAERQASASIAADGLRLYAARSPLARTLAYPDFVSVCGRHVALAAGGDRYAMHGKRILFDGRDVSRDPSRSWVSPSCTADGTLIAAASRNTTPSRIGNEHRAIWQLLPRRRRLTHPPRDRSDEDPHLLPDGSVVFVRTRTVSKPFELYGVGTVEFLRNGRLTAIGTAGKAGNFYGHYAWPDVVAVATRR